MAWGWPRVKRGASMAASGRCSVETREMQLSWSGRGRGRGCGWRGTGTGRQEGGRTGLGAGSHDPRSTDSEGGTPWFMNNL